MSPLRPTVVALVAAALLGGCDLTFPWTNDASPVLEVTPASLTFTAALGDPAPQPQVVQVRAERVTHSLGVEWDQPLVSGVVGLYPSRLEISVPAPGVLGPGDWTGQVRIWQCDEGPSGCVAVPGTAPVVVAITYRVTLAVGLNVLPSALTFDYVEGGDLPAPQTVALASNGSSGAWTSAVDAFAAWIAVTPSSGRGTPDSATISVSPPFPFFSPGTYTGHVQFAQGTSTTLLEINLTWRAPIVTLAPAAVSFRAVAGQVDLPPPRDVAVTLAAGKIPWTSRVTYADPTAGAWLDVTPAGEAPDTLRVSVSRTDLPPGTYQATVSVERGAVTLAQLPVTFDVQAPFLEVVPSALRFDVGTTTTAAGLQALLSLGGASGIAWTAAGDQPWLSVAPAAGVGPGTVVASVPMQVLEGTALGTGVWEGALTISYREPSGVPVAIEVPVQLSLSLPTVEAVAPEAEVAGLAGSVLVRGQWLGAGDTILFDALAAAGPSTPDPGGWRVPHPPLPPAFTRWTWPTRWASPAAAPTSPPCCRDHARRRALRRPGPRPGSPSTRSGARSSWPTQALARWSATRRPPAGLARLWRSPGSETPP